MYKTPVNEKKRRSVVNDNSAMTTPLGGLGASVVEPSVLNTPEEPGTVCGGIFRSGPKHEINFLHNHQGLKVYFIK